MTDPARELIRLARQYREKESDYGQSWRRAAEIIWKLGGEEPITLHSLDDVIRFGMYYRRFDKFSGAFEGEFGGDDNEGQDLTFEDAMNRHGDEAVYAVIHGSTHAASGVDEPPETDGGEVEDYLADPQPDAPVPDGPVESGGFGWFDALGEPVPDSHRRFATEFADDVGAMVEPQNSRAWVDSIASAIERDMPETAVERAKQHLDVTGAYRLLSYLCVGPSDPDATYGGDGE